MLASGVVAGQFEAQWVYDKQDVDGIRYEDELIRHGYKGDEANRLTDAKAYLEPHIERGRCWTPRVKTAVSSQVRWVSQGWTSR